MHVILFDIDGTLLNSGGAGKAAIEAALTDTFRVTLSAEVTYSGRTDRAICRDLLQLHGIDETTANWQRLLHAYLERLPGALTFHRGQVLPGITRLLQTLQGRANAALGLLTGNVHAGARLKLGHFGLFEHFAFGGFGDHHYDRDEVAHAALAAARTHLDRQVAPDQVWVIGDTPLDVKCARAIGARVLAVATGWHSLAELARAEPDLLVPNLENPLPLLRLLT